MINIIPIPAPFSPDIISVEVTIPNYNLQDNSPLLSISLYHSTGQLYKTIEQPIPENIHAAWQGDNEYIINWSLDQNQIQKA